ncbi:hypothetical protein WH47_12196, partial [Habropoda laboriosa]
LCLLLFVVCQAARIPRISDQSYYPNFRNVYPGEHYQNGGPVENHARVPFFGDYKPQAGHVDVGHGYYPGQGGIGGQGSLVNRLSGASFDGFKVQGNVPQHYERFNHGLDYDYHL